MRSSCYTFDEMNASPTFEFHVSRSARDRYDFSHALFSITGNVVFADLAATREFAHRMNQVREAEKHPERAVNPGSLNAMGLIDEALHLLFEQYRTNVDPKAIADALAHFEARLGREALDKTLIAFANEFPTVSVYRGEQSAKEWISESTNEIPNCDI